MITITLLSFYLPILNIESTIIETQQIPSILNLFNMSCICGPNPSSGDYNVCKENMKRLLEDMKVPIIQDIVPKNREIHSQELALEMEAIAISPDAPTMKEIGDRIAKLKREIQLLEGRKEMVGIKEVSTFETKRSRWP